MKTTLALIATALAMAAVSSSRADDIATNGSFEEEDFRGPIDSAYWNEIASGGPGTVSERVNSGATAGEFSHHLLAVGANGIGGTAVIIQNTRAEGGKPSLVGLSTVSATFKAHYNLGPGGVGFYALRVLNSGGAIVADSGLRVVTSSNSGYATFSVGPITVPALGDAPNDFYAAFIELSVAAGAFPESNAEANIDEVVINGTVGTPSCPADFDGDGTVDFFDYDAFVVCFEGGSCPSGKTADFDGDGAVDFFDYDAFVQAFELGC